MGWAVGSNVGEDGHYQRSDFCCSYKLRSKNEVYTKGLYKTALTSHHHHFTGLRLLQRVQQHPAARSRVQRYVIR